MNGINKILEGLRDFEVEKIYIDLDQTAADFEGGVRKLTSLKDFKAGESTEEQDNLMWEEIRKVDNFYDKLEPLPGVKKLFDDLVEVYGDKVEILTAIPKPKRGILTAEEDKIRWVRRELSKNVKINIVYSGEKKKFCKGKGYVLIDDLKSNNNQWKSYGGTDILFTNSNDVRRKLKELGIL